MTLDEVLYVEYRHDDNCLPLNFKFYKKSIIIKKNKSKSVPLIQNKYNEGDNNKKENK